MTPPQSFSTSKKEVTNADIMAALKALRQEVKGHSDRLAKHDDRIKSLESMRELVLSTHETLATMRADMTKLKQLMDAHDVSFADALRRGVKEIVEGTRAAAAAEIKAAFESVDCPRCLARKAKGDKS